MLAAILLFGILTPWVQARWALSIFQVAIFVLATAGIIRQVRAGCQLSLHPIGWLLAGIVACGLSQIAFGWSVDIQKTQEATLDWFVNLVVLCLALQLGRDFGNRERFLQAVLVFSGILAAVAVLTALTSPPGTLWWRFPAESSLPTLGPFVYRNQYAAFVEAILPLAIVSALRDRQRWLPYTLITAVLFGSVIEGGSRTGAVLCLAELFVVPVLVYSRGAIPRRILVRTLIGGTAAVALFAGAIGWESIWNRFQEPNPYTVRLHFVQSSITMVRTRPLIGFGLGTWSSAYPAYALFDDGNFANQAHNDWVQWTAEGGMPVLAILLVIAGYSLRPAVRSIWGIGILAVFLHGLVDYPFQQRPALAGFFFAWLGIVIAAGTVTSAGPYQEDRHKQ